MTFPKTRTRRRETCILSNASVFDTPGSAIIQLRNQRCASDADDGHVTIRSLRRIPAILDIHTLCGRFDLGTNVGASSPHQLDIALDQIGALPDMFETQNNIRPSSVKAH